MAPRTCFYGRAEAGSFQVRAVQVASCRPEWTATAVLTPEHWLEHDVFVFVKWPEPRKARLLRALGKRVVIDLLDGWEQPRDDRRVVDLEGARALFSARWGEMPVDATIWTTRAMADDLGPLFPPGRVIHHHWRPGLTPQPLREQVRRVGYEGEEAFLGPWRGELQRACHELGLELLLNPPEPGLLDLVVAARGGDHDGWLSRRYKSNVKLANCYGAGLPALVQASSESYRETACPGLPTFSTPAELRAGLRALLPLEARRRLREALLGERERYSLQRVAADYQELLEALPPVTPLRSTRSTGPGAGRATGSSAG